MVNVMIAVPTRGTVSAKFMASLVGLAHATKCNLALEVCMGSSILQGRESLIKKSISGGYSHILWLDSDMEFPTDLLDRLIEHNAPVAACAYANAYTLKPNVYNTSDAPWLSLGCSLIQVAVLNSMIPPYFSMEYDHITGRHMSEWYTFCKKLNELKAPILIDWELSKQVFHDVSVSAPLTGSY